MPTMFLLIRRKGTKKFLGAKPIRKGTSMKKIKAIMRKMPKGFSFKVVSKKQLENFIIRTLTQKKRTKKRRKRR